MILESVTVQSELFHSVVVECANSVGVGTSSQILELVFCLVQIEDFFDAVEVFSNVVLVFFHFKGAVDLVLKHFYFNNYTIV